MRVREGDQVRLLADLVGSMGHRVPAGTIGTIVDDVNAPAQYAVDVQVNDTYDNVAVSPDQFEALPETQ
jgi:hypothetical protein